MISEKLPSNLERPNNPTNLKSIIHNDKDYSQVVTGKTADGLPRSGHPGKFIPKSDCAILREIAKKKVKTQMLWLDHKRAVA